MNRHYFYCGKLSLKMGRADKIEKYRSYFFLKYRSKIVTPEKARTGCMQMQGSCQARRESGRFGARLSSRLGEFPCPVGKIPKKKEGRSRERPSFAVPSVYFSRASFKRKNFIEFLEMPLQLAILCRFTCSASTRRR